MKLTHAALLMNALALIFSLSCSTDSEPHAQRLPERLESHYSTEIGRLSSATSLQGKRPVLILDNIPSEPGRAAIAGGCIQTLPADFELGFAICSDGERLPLLAKHVEQRCEVLGQEAVYPLTDALVSESCPEAQLVAFLFDPPLRILITTP